MDYLRTNTVYTVYILLVINDVILMCIKQIMFILSGYIFAST